MNDDKPAAEEGGSSGDYQPKSYADIRGEWEQRRISLVGAARSLITQLRAGQDLTRVSLPCVFLRPYSLLEEVASRNFARFDLLFEVSKKDKPVDRMLAVVRWLVTGAKKESFNHKPYNPVIGETVRVFFPHLKSALANGDLSPSNSGSSDKASSKKKDKSKKKKKDRESGASSEGESSGSSNGDADSSNNDSNDASNGTDAAADKAENGGDDLDSVTYLLAEQVSHHPPTCGIRIDNPAHKVSIQGHYTFQVKFHGNSVSVANNGSVVIRIGDEDYYMEKAMPDILIKNVIIGSKSVVWDGPISFECEQTGLKGSFELASKRGANTIRGQIVGLDDPDAPLAIVEGECGGVTKYYNVDPDEPDRKPKKDDWIVLTDVSTIQPNIPHYPEPLDETSSINIWKEVSKHIIANDMVNGDEEKKKIEARQREMLGKLDEEGKSWDPVYFEIDEERDSWKIKNLEWYKDFPWEE